MDDSSARSRIQQIFNYLREYNKIKTPPVMALSSYPWLLEIKKLPKYPSIQFFDLDNPNSADGILFKVKRTSETDCPKPPIEITQWLENGWEKINIHSPKFLSIKNFQDKEGKTFSKNFEDEPERVRAAEDWSKLRNKWLEAERPAREANEVYSNLFKLQGTLDRESEKYQLYIADGHFIYKSEFGEIEHPIILKKVHLDFIPEKQEFIIYDGEDEAELYSSLLRFHGLNGEAIFDSKKKIQEDEIHPIGNGKTDEFCKYFISRFFRDGEFVQEDSIEKEIGCPTIFRHPVIILSTKSQGFTEAIEKLADAIPRMEKLPEALIRIIGIQPQNSKQDYPPELPKVTTNRPNLSKNEVDFLLTKPTNKEQERVIQKLEESGAVLVQGPPGTGKSHTIANIIGHLLASGKKVIVSSHTSKALRVVREKVVEELKPLCVSVLDNDHESKSQLADSINKIVNYHSQTDVTKLGKEISELGERRIDLKSKIQLLSDEILNIRKSEYSSIVFEGENIEPSEAARLIRDNSEEIAKIPLPIKISSPFPLSNEELSSLYRTNTSLTSDEEHVLEGELPDIDKILKPSDVKELSSLITALEEQDLKNGAMYWNSNENLKVEMLEPVCNHILELRKIFSSEEWLQECMESSILSDTDDENGWIRFFNLVSEINKNIKTHIHKEQLFLPDLTDAHTLEVASEIYNHLSLGKNLGALTLLFKPAWKQFVTTARVIDGQPKTKDHFESIVSQLEVKKLRSELNVRWERHIVSIGGSPLPSVFPERTASSYLGLIDNAINWKNEWLKTFQKLCALGLDCLKIETEIKKICAGKTVVQQMDLFSEKILIILDSKIKWIRHRILVDKIEATIISIASVKSSDAGKILLVGLQDSLRNLAPDDYEKYFNAVLDLTSKRQIFHQRQALLSKLKSNAEGLAVSIKYRKGIHGAAQPPENIFFAWKARQLSEILNENHKSDYSKLQDDLVRHKKLMEQATGAYVEKLSWKFQKLKTSHQSWQALQGWLQVQKKLSKTGRGKRDAVFLKESRTLIREARAAVPVWIMPISKIIENFDLASTRFDVLILDEASQSDIMALIAFAIADQVIVVGDNEQVTPYAVGIESNRVQSLINELLRGIPNKVLYDGETSIYDLAQQSFGETIRLIEHFRCVPDIIRFSNQLSYNGEIKPLREAASSPYSLHTISHRVQGNRLDGKTNLVEAEEIASLICAMIESDEYQLNDENKKTSFGMISLLGDEQAFLVESILKENLDPTIYSERKILCGNSSQFQGDERDIVFISIVDSSSDGTPLSLKGYGKNEMYKKMYNVAASRARNQLWVVHSLDPQTELKAGDLRLRLIQHAQAPRAIDSIIDEVGALAESPFEKSVQADLIREGYKIIPQWKVGAYRIDMVAISSNNKKVAIECDGERYHSGERLQDDIYRQMVLERLGWQFIRIRGSEYYKEPSKCMSKVFTKLNNIGIDKFGNFCISEEKPKIDEAKEKILRKAFQIREEWKLKKQKMA